MRHPLFARLYARMSAKAESRGAAAHRQEMLSGLRGRVVEVGAGNGLNFAHYPSAVEEVVAVEPEPHLRRLAEAAGAAARAPITVLEGDGEALPLEDSSCDAAVCSLVLCSVPDQSKALGEVRRVLRPGGELRFYEHVVANSPGFARAQRLLDRTIWPRLGGGCHCSRDTLSAIKAAGFEVARVRRFSFKPCAMVVASAPHVLGVAVRS